MKKFIGSMVDGFCDLILIGFLTVVSRWLARMAAKMIDDNLEKKSEK